MSYKINAITGKFDLINAAPSPLVTSVTSPLNTLSVSPTTGDVEIDLNLGHQNIWTVPQTFTNGDQTVVLTDDNVPFTLTAYNTATNNGIGVNYNGYALTVTGVSMFSQLATFSGSVQINSLTPGSVLFLNSSNQIAEDTTHLHWDETFRRLGIGTNTPDAPLTVVNSSDAIVGHFTNSTQELVLAEGSLSGYLLRGTDPSFQFFMGQGFGFAIADTITGNAVAFADYTSNYAINVLSGNSTFAGNIGIFNGSPSELLTLGAVGTKGTLSLLGNTSGKVIIQPAAAAGTWSLTLPTTGGTNLFLLQTNGSGVTTWANPTSLGLVNSVSNSDGTLTISPTTGTVVASLALGHANTWTGQQTFSTSAPIFSTMTAGSVLFAGASGVLSQDNTNLNWNNSTKVLQMGPRVTINTVDGTMVVNPVVQGGIGVYSSTVIPVMEVGDLAVGRMQFYFAAGTAVFGTFGNTNPMAFGGSAIFFEPVGDVSFLPGSGHSSFGATAQAPAVRVQIGNRVTDDNVYSYNANILYITNQTPTSTSTLNDPQPTLMLARQGTGGQAYGAAALFSISRYANSSTDSKTRLDISLADNSFDPASNIVMTYLANGRVGINTTAPTARLHLPISTTSASTAQTKFTLGGSLMTSPEAGAMEAINSHIYWTDSTSTRYQLDQQVLASYTTADLTAQTTAVASVVAVTSPNDGSAHQYRVGAYINVTALVLDVAQVQCTYTDENSNSVTANFFPQGLTSANIASTGSFSLPPQDIRVKANTAITIKTVLTTSTGSITYDVGGSIQRIN